MKVTNHIALRKLADIQETLSVLNIEIAQLREELNDPTPPDNIPINPEDELTLSELCSRLKVSRQTVYNYIDLGLEKNGEDDRFIWGDFQKWLTDSDHSFRGETKRIQEELNES